MRKIIEALHYQRLVISSGWAEKQLPILFAKIHARVEECARSGEHHHNEIRNQSWKQDGYYIEVVILEESFDSQELEFYLSPFGLEETLSGPAWLKLNASEYLKEGAAEIESLIALMVKKIAG